MKVQTIAILMIPLVALLAGCSLSDDVSPRHDPTAKAVQTQALGSSTSICGDGILDEMTEQCDDGNIDPINYRQGDYCASDCSTGIDTTGKQCSETAVQDLVDDAITHVSNITGMAGVPAIATLPPNAKIKFCEAGCDQGDSLLAPYNGPGRACVVASSPIALRGNHSRIDLPQERIAFQLEGNSSSANELFVYFPTIADPNAAPVWRPDPHNGIAFKLKGSQMKLRDLRVFHPGTAVHLHATGGVNVNNPTVQDSYIYGCSNYGIYTDGADAQGGVFSNNMILACKNAGGDATGIYEGSQVGNAYVGNLMEANDIGIHIPSTQQANASAWLGTYIESSDQTQLESNSQVVLGGPLGDRSSVARGSRISGSKSHVRFEATDADGHGTFAEMPYVDSTNGEFKALLYWGYRPVGGACTTSADCTSPGDSCVSSVCKQVQSGVDYWQLRRSLTSPTDRFEWEFYNTNGGTGMQFGIEKNTDGYYRVGTISAGNFASSHGSCGELEGVCAP